MARNKAAKPSSKSSRKVFTSNVRKDVVENWQLDSIEKALEPVRQKIRDIFYRGAAELLEQAFKERDTLIDFAIRGNPSKDPLDINVLVGDKEWFSFNLREELSAAMDAVEFDLGEGEEADSMQRVSAALKKLAADIDSLIKPKS